MEIKIEYTIKCDSCGAIERCDNSCYGVNSIAQAIKFMNMHKRKDKILCDYCDGIR
jgi:primosomal protein N'